MNSTAAPATQKAKTPDHIAYENLLKICPYLLTMKTDSFVELAAKPKAAPLATIGCKDESGIYEIIADYQGKAQTVTFEVDSKNRTIETLIFQERGRETQTGDDISPQKLQALIRNLVNQGYMQKDVVRENGIA